MALNFGTASSHVDFGSGSITSPTAFTFLSLLRPAANNNSILTLYNTSTIKRGYIIDTSHIFGDNDFSSGFGTTTNNDWWWLGMSKAAGSAHFRCHMRNYTTAGAWSHGEAVGAANQTDPGATNKIVIGSGVTATAGGDMAVNGVWNSNLADLTIEGACTTLLSDFMAASPGWAIRFQNGFSTSIQDQTGGGGNETGRTGTFTDVTDPPSYNFTLGGGGAPKNGQFMVFF